MTEQLVLCRVPRVVWKIVFNYIPTKYARSVCSVCKFFNKNFWDNRDTLRICVDINLVNNPIPYQFNKVHELELFREPTVNNIKFYKWIESWPVLVNIRSLCINQIGPGDSEIIVTRTPRLAKLNLDITSLVNYSRRYNWSFLTEDFLLQLTEFTLKGLYTIQRNERLEYLNRGLRNCTRLCFGGVPIFIESSEILFKGLVNVTSLELSGENVVNETFDIVVREMPNLRELIMPRRNNNLLTAGALRSLDHLHKLRILNIAGFYDCSDVITDSIFQANPKLRCVYMNGCSSLTDLTLHSISRYLPKIKEISFRDCYLLTDDIFNSLAHIPLSVMNFAICPNISNKGIEQFCKAWQNGNPYLRSVNFANSPKVTVVGIQMIKDTCINLITY